MTLYKQQGVVLVVALVFLIALTGVAAALMQNTTSDMKMAGASNEKVVATQAAISAVDEVINNQVNTSVNVFTQGLQGLVAAASAVFLPTTTVTGAVANASVISNPSFDELACPRSLVAFSVGIIECNFLQLQIQRPYGRNSTSTIVINTNIVQQLLPNN